METEIEVRRGHVDLFLAGLRAMGVPFKVRLGVVRPNGVQLVSRHRVVVAEEDAIPARVILGRVAEPQD